MPDDGKVLACDSSDEYSRVGVPQWRVAGVAHKINLQLAPALTTLDARINAGEQGQYDFAFIDADKSGYDAYYERCLVLFRQGGLIAIDNTLWSGKVTIPAEDADIAALQALNRKLHRDARVDLSMLPIGDGLTLARKRWALKATASRRVSRQLPKTPVRTELVEVRMNQGIDSR